MDRRIHPSCHRKISFVDAETLDLSVCGARAILRDEGVRIARY
jgi:hypothetical protein